MPIGRFFQFRTCICSIVENSISEILLIYRYFYSTKYLVNMPSLVSKNAFMTILYYERFITVNIVSISNRIKTCM